jgi:hypothetical protein
MKKNQIRRGIKMIFVANKNKRLTDKTNTCLADSGYAHLMLSYVVLTGQYQRK